ncbi:putative oxidoreductase CipA-like protein [Massariosphaeria phaeospora]|uniref:Putative oxidoreductase CipA-like protein n=1 Tax=Massariosphaeria phaeospora TaxID=100035 RepID=A0A7C8MBP4_9PLEO|nr:putative oxidoreductase CipA-like protein [Massariosphaeria phaeospora]
MTTIQNVAIAGASGNLGISILHALLNSKAFNVTVLSRESSTATFPDSVTVVHVDYTSVPDLTATLKGQDAVVSAVGTAAINTQHPLIEASVAAGVARFIPSEFSADIDNAMSSALPVYQPQITVHKALQGLAQTHPAFTYTLIRNGVLLDWSMAKGFVIAFDSETPSLYDGGDRPLSVSNLASVGQAVVGVLRNPRETRNRVMYVHDLVITQNKVLAMARKLAPARTWNPVVVDTADLEARSRDAYAKGVVTIHSSLGLLIRAAFGEGYGGEFQRVDNELLGVGFKTDVDLEAMVKDAMDHTLVPGS